MATENKLETISLLAAGDLSTKQYCHVKVTADRTMDVAGNGQEAAGILQDKPAAAGRAGAVGISGISKVLIGTGGLTAGGYCSSAADGTGVAPATGERITGYVILGGAAGGVGEILLGSYGAAP